MVRSLLVGSLAVLSLLFSLVPSALAAQPSESLLPPNTKGYLSIGRVDRLTEQFSRSQLGHLAADPTMKPFVEGLKSQLQQQGLKQLEQLGLSWNELDGVSAGELAVAVIQPAPEQAAVALLADVTGHGQQAQVLLSKVSERMTKLGAKRLRRGAGDSIIAYQLPAEPGRRVPPTAAYALQHDMLMASDNLSVLEGITQALSGEPRDSLANVPAYREIMARCATTGGGLTPDLRWFIEPFGYAETLRVAAPLRDRRNGPDLLKILKSQGFTAIQGVGGLLNFSAGKYEVLHRTMVYAPPIAGRDPQGKDKYNLAARTLRFPTGGNLQPQSWVPRDVATYSTFNWDMRTAFASAGSLVDELIGQKGVFRDVLDSLRDDPEGPRIDMEKDLIAHLGSRATILSDCELPIGPKCERKVVAFEVTDEAKMTTAIGKLMAADKDARRREFDGSVIWELVDPQSEVPTLIIETPGVEIPNVPSEPPSRRDPRNDRLLSTTAVCVARGHLFLASHIELLQRVLSERKQTSHLDSASDYRLIAKHGTELGLGSLSFRMFSRSDQELRPTYELIRTGQMPQSETIFAKLLNSVLGEGKDGGPRKQRIDGHQLPEFDAVQRYLGPAATFVSSQDDGWLAVGIMLGREPIIVEAPAKAIELPKAAEKSRSDSLPKAEIGRQKSGAGVTTR